MNPVFFGEVSSRNYIELLLYFVNFRFNIDLIGYRAEPFNFVFSWNLDDLANCCWGLSWAAEGVDFYLDLEVFSNECSVGLFGAIFDHETFTCSLTQYTPAQHLLSFSIQDVDNVIDFGDDWVPYTCNYYWFTKYRTYCACVKNNYIKIIIKHLYRSHLHKSNSNTLKSSILNIQHNFALYFCIIQHLKS